MLKEPVAIQSGTQCSVNGLTFVAQVLDERDVPILLEDTFEELRLHRRYDMLA